jgi:hypothetical protein
MRVIPVSTDRRKNLITILNSTEFDSISGGPANCVLKVDFWVLFINIDLILFKLKEKLEKSDCSAGFQNGGFWEQKIQKNADVQLAAVKGRLRVDMGQLIFVGNSSMRAATSLRILTATIAVISDRSRKGLNSTISAPASGTCRP